MRILFITEGNYQGQVQKEQVGRTDANWIHALDADHTCINNFKPNDLYDIGIYIIPKKNPKLDDNTFEQLANICTKVGVMQEADQIQWQRYSVPDQIQYLHFLNKVDFILCHNEIDEHYYSGLFPLKPVSVLPTLLLDYNLKSEYIARKEQRSGVMLGGTWCDWYSGQDSYIISQEFTNERVFAPSMGRKQPEEDYIEDIEYLAYTDWTNWMYDLSRCKYAIHLMRTYAAGSFQLNCAYLKIPCLGWKGTDTQNLLFPELSPNEGDMVEARKIAKHLYTNQLFYDHVVEYAHKVYLDIFSEPKFKEKVTNFLSNL